MVSDRKLANVVAGKSARPCDNCVKKRARWYCAADDAFLCRACDSSVHSANALARRHERVLLRNGSSPASPSKSELRASAAWHKGFTTKARTPRHKKKAKNISDHQRPPPLDDTIDGNNNNHVHHLVPEISMEEETSYGEIDQVQLLYRVPIFEPFDSQVETSNEPFCEKGDQVVSNLQSFHEDDDDDDQDMMMSSQNLLGFLPSEADLAEFGADLESLLGKGVEDEGFDLGIFDSKAREGFVKVEGDDDVVRDALELNFDYDSPIYTTLGDELEAEMEKKEGILRPIVMNEVNDINVNSGNKGFGSKKTFLRLDCKGVISAWDNKRSPWTNGERPNFDSGDCFRPNCMGACGTLMHMYGDIGMMGGHVASMADVVGREARVSRYREKRRTRLFSKKIRYEVRKLNAEKRPRMKGRFVKRSILE